MLRRRKIRYPHYQVSRQKVLFLAPKMCALLDPRFNTICMIKIVIIKVCRQSPKTFLLLCCLFFLVYFFFFFYFFPTICVLRFLWHFSSDLSNIWPVERYTLVEQLYTFLGAKVKVTRWHWMKIHSQQFLCYLYLQSLCHFWLNLLLHFADRHWLVDYNFTFSGM